MAPDLINNIYNAYTWECQIALATLIGATIGLERELRHKSAGIRTYAVIAMASCLFSILSKLIGGDHDPGRIAANIVTGIGFLGAGLIWHNDDGKRVEGLTSAAAMWCVSGMGMAIGFGYLYLAIAASIIVLTIMELFGFIVTMIKRIMKK